MLQISLGNQLCNSPGGCHCPKQLPSRKRMEHGGRKRAAEDRVRVFSSSLPQGPAQPTQVLCLSQDPGNSQPPWIKAVICADSVVRLSGFKSLCTHSLALCTWAGDSPLLAYFLICKMALILELSEGINKNVMVKKVKHIKPLELNLAQDECLIKGVLVICTFFFFNFLHWFTV